MSYKFKGQKVIINGTEQIIVPGSLPVSPTDGYYAIDSADGKLKVWVVSKNRWVVLGDASDIVFNNQTNGFSSTNVQSAIEEARTKSISIARFTICCTFNGTVSNNSWLGHSEVLPGNQVPIRLPIKCRLKEVSFSYNQTNLLGTPLSSENIDGRFDLYKNGLTSPTNVVWQGSFVNQPGGKYFTGINIDFNPGDYMVGRWIDQGDNPSDMAIVYYFEIRE